MSVKVLFEIGHEAAIRDKETPNGFTHDWEVFVRGGSGADISHFIDKIVFHLHETFEKPKRVVKEPPYNVKDSGYGSFTLLIEIYLKNRGEPKKIQFNYDLHLQQTGPPIIKTQKEKYVFSNVTEEFKKKLIKGGGIIVPDTVNFDNDRFKDSEEKGQLLGKPKLGGDIHKRHKPKEHRSEEPTKTNSFADLFGTPITKGSKVSPDAKKSSPSPKMTASSSSVSLMSSAKKDEKIVKEKIEKPDKGKGKHSPQKERDRDSKPKEDRTREDRRKAHSKERERSRDSSKRPTSPKRSPSRPKSSSSGRPEEVKVKQDGHEKKSDSSKDKKAKKEKRSHDKDKDRDKKEHRRDKDKEVVAAVKATPLQKPEIKAPVKEKDIVVKEKEKPHDKERSVAKPSDTPNSVKLDTPENKIEPKNETKTNTEKKERDGERRHKHKKKDKKKDESRADKDKEFREKKNKDKDKDKVSAVKPAVLKDVPQNNGDNSNSTYTKPTHKEKNPLNKLMGELSDKPSDDSDNSNKSEDVKLVESKDIPVVERPVNENSNSQEKTAEKVKEKTKKNKSKNADKEERKRKRRSKEELPDNTKVMSEPEPPPKVPRREPSPEPAPSEESPVENRSPEPVEESPDDSSQHIPPDYMSELKDLQHKIMTMQDNEELQQVVQMIAETGQYEVTPKTFDFDLCTLDRSTVQRLQEFFATS